MTYQPSLFGEDNFESQFRSLMRMIPSQDADYATHNVHPYPAKFLPHYPEIFIRQFSAEHDLVVDPMCGSGTTLIAACLQNRRAYGVDIDPIAALVSKVSITPIPEQALVDYARDLFGELRTRLDRDDADKVKLPSDEEYPNAEIWFREDVFRELLLIRDTILELGAPESLQHLALLCLSRIVKSVSNADPRDIFPERDQENLVREREDVWAHFRRAFHDNRTRVTDFSRRVNSEERGEVCHGDGRSINLPDGVTKLVFTSPPYAYAMDYARVHKLSTLLFLMSNEELREHRREYVGTDRVSVGTPLESFEGFEFAREEIESVHSQRRKLGVILYQYFSDMYRVTKECQRILQPRGYLVYVVGNSTVRRTTFHTDQVFAGMCERVGLKLVQRLERPYYAYRMARKRNVQSNTIKADVFLVAQKP